MTYASESPDVLFDNSVRICVSVSADAQNYFQDVENHFQDVEKIFQDVENMF